MRRTKTSFGITIATLRVLVSAGAVLGNCTLATAAEQWMPIAVDNANVEFSVDVGTLKRDGDRVTFRERVVFAVPDQRDAASGKLIKEKQMLRVMHCKDKTQGLKSGSLIDENRRVIETVNFDDPSIRWSAIPEGTLAERELALVCEPREQAKPGAKPP